jgi:hypothetical protein
MPQYLHPLTRHPRKDGLLLADRNQMDLIHDIVLNTLSDRYRQALLRATRRAWRSEPGELA